MGAYGAEWSPGPGVGGVSRDHRYMSVWEGLRAARVWGPLSLGLAGGGAGGAPGWPVSGLLAGQPRVDVSVFRVVVLGRLWGLGLGSFAGVRCRGVARVRRLLSPYLCGWPWFPSQQEMPGAPTSLLLRDAAVGAVEPPVWMHVLAGGSVVCRPPMAPERP